MHWATILGIILVAAGTALTIYGGILQNRLDSAETTEVVTEKIEEALDQISSIKTEIDPKRAESITEVEDDFTKWADSFISERSKRRIEFDRHQLSSRESEITLTAESAPLVSLVFDVIGRLVRAYNEKTDENIRATLPSEFPENMYRESVEGTVEFTSEITWKVWVAGNLPASEPPRLKIRVSIDSSTGSSGLLVLQLQPESNEILVFLLDDGFPNHIISNNTLPIHGYEADVRELLTKAMEVTLHRLQ